MILVQTPPAIPTLPVALAVARLRGAKLVVDWHNLGWTLLALRFGSAHALVRAVRNAEIRFGKRADGHLAVSAAMAGRLSALGLRDVAVLHDGPSPVRPFPPARADSQADPLVVVAPMGWTRDDDLALLAEALQLLGQQMKASRKGVRGLRLLVSGDGPLRAQWGPKLRALGKGGLQVETPNVAPDEYPHLLASSHLGLSLHRSSSGLDLPMKVVELRTVGVPVLILEDGSPLDEVAPPGCGALRYTTGVELADHLFAATSEGQNGGGLMEQLAAQARKHPPAPWEERWRIVMSPFLITPR